MSTLSSPRSSLDRTAPARSKTKSNTWALSLTTICFLFGGLLAMQLRAVETSAKNRNLEKTKQVIQKQRAANFRDLAAKAERAYAASQLQITLLKSKLAQTGNLSTQQVKALNTQISSLQMAAGLITLQGSGVRITIDDNPNAAKAIGNRDGFAPGLIHDFDLLQIVNELRSLNPEAIGIRGAGQSESTRITGYTPIRCVGPAILVAGQPIAPPFVIEAIGNSQALDKGVNMAGGILKNLGDINTGAALQVKTTRVDNLILPAATGAPRFSVAKPLSATATP